MPSEARKRDAGMMMRQRSAMLGEPAAGLSEHEESEDWVVSYMDMVTLLMIVFLTLVGMLWIDKKTRPTVINVLQVETGQLPARDFEADPEPAVPVQRLPASLPANVTIAPAMQMTVDRWLDALQRAGLDGQVQLQIQERRVSMQIRDRLLFSSGQNDLRQDGQLVIRRLAELLRNLPGVISVEGHTDDQPIHSERFPSNWELSAARAATVVRALTEQGMPARRLRAIGYGDSRPVAAGADLESRAQNRRVTLVIED